MKVTRRTVLLLLVVLSAACNTSVCGVKVDRAQNDSASPAPPAPRAPSAPQAPSAPDADPDAPKARPRIVALGDSLTAGYGLVESQSYPALLQKKIDEDGYEFEMVNAGVSGDTSAGGLRRLDWALEGDVRVLIVALGANDGLRGLSVNEMKANLTEIIQRAKDKGTTVILAGMEAPPNYGQEYAAAFRQAFRDVAQKERVLFIPFLLQGVAGQGALNQGDAIHPNQKGTEIVAENVWKVLKPMLDQMDNAGTGS
jgi:acyl-CoA thioesterase-1